MVTPVVVVADAEHLFLLPLEQQPWSLFRTPADGLDSYPSPWRLPLALTPVPTYFVQKKWMKIPNAQIAVMMAQERLAEIFGVPELTPDARGDGPSFRDILWEAVCTVRGHSFGLIWRRVGSLGHLGGAIYRLGREGQLTLDQEVIPLMVVPFMARAAQERCAQIQLCWMDLSGNARIVTPTIFYQSIGNPNRFPRLGRPESAFGPRGSRIMRRLLMDPSEAVRQRDLAFSAGLDEGHTSRIVRKLSEAGLVERGEDGIRVVDANVLLDAWQEDYRFDRHHVIRGRIPAPGGDTLVHALAEALSKAEEPYAAMPSQQHGCGRATVHSISAPCTFRGSRPRG